MLKIEVEDNSDEDKNQRFIMTTLTAITLSTIVQWIFGQRARRNRVQSTPPEMPQEEEASDGFEIVSEPEEVNEIAIENQQLPK